MEGIFSVLDRLEKHLSKNKPPQLVPSGKIVGGTNATQGMFPFVASLKIRNLNR
jgi:secreted trypsin-like serine protease